MATVFDVGYNDGYGNRLSYNPNDSLQQVLNTILPGATFGKSSYSMEAASPTANIAVKPLPSAKGKLLIPRELTFSTRHDSDGKRISLHSLTSVNEYLRESYEVAITRLHTLSISTDDEESSLYLRIKSMDQTSLNNVNAFNDFMDKTKSTSNKPLRMLFCQCILSQFAPVGIVVLDSDENIPRGAAKATGYSAVKTLTISGKSTIFPYFPTLNGANTSLCLILKKEKGHNSISQAERLGLAKQMGMDGSSFAFFPAANPRKSDILYVSRGLHTIGRVIKIGKVISNESSPFSGDVSSRVLSGINYLSDSGNTYARIANTFPAAGTEIAYHVDYF